MKIGDRNINCRADEGGNPNGFQITFRTTERLSGLWSSLRGLCKGFGHDETSAELFREVVVPAMQEYVERKGYLAKARNNR